MWRESGVATSMRYLPERGASLRSAATHSADDRGGGRKWAFAHPRGCSPVPAFERPRGRCRRETHVGVTGPRSGLDAPSRQSPSALLDALPHPPARPLPPNFAPHPGRSGNLVREQQDGIEKPLRLPARPPQCKAGKLCGRLGPVAPGQQPPRASLRAVGASPCHLTVPRGGRGRAGAAPAPPERPDARRGSAIRDRSWRRRPGRRR